MVKSPPAGSAKSTPAAGNRGAAAQAQAEAEPDAGNQGTVQVTASSTPQTQTTGSGPPAVVSIGGITIELNTTANIVADRKVLYTKEARKQLTEEKKIDLFDKAVRVTGDKYDLVSLSLTTDTKLDDCAQLGVMVEKTRDAHQLYDMDNVFTVVKPLTPGDSGLQSKTFDLYKDYMMISEQEVAYSCKWYQMWPKEPWFRENLTLTERHIQNSMKKGLLEKCMEQYQAYPEEERGGPLLFVIMMKLLVSNTEMANDHLKEMVKNLKIRDYQGEDVPRVVSLLRWAYMRFKRNNKIPEHFDKTVLDVLQTSSVQEFTDIFKQIKLNTTIAERMPWTQNASKTYSVEDLLKLAETSYTALSSGNKWTGAKTKGKNSVFNASDQNSGKGGGARKATDSICFNCGEKGHRLNDCQKPKNDQRIAAAKKKFQEAKKSRGADGGTDGGTGGGKNQSEGGSKSKWRQPESGEENKRVIDGKHMWYNKGTKRWVLDRFHPTNRTAQEEANMAQGTTGAGQSQQPSNPTPNTNQDAAKTAAMANFTRTMETALNGLLNNFTN
jgi:hypothetical protein